MLSEHIWPAFHEIRYCITNYIGYSTYSSDHAFRTSYTETPWDKDTVSSTRLVPCLVILAWRRLLCSCLKVGGIDPD